MSVTPVIYSPKIMVSNVDDKKKILSERFTNKTQAEIEKNNSHLDVYS